MKKKIMALWVICAVVILSSGWGKKEGDEPTKYVSQDQLAKMSGYQETTSDKKAVNNSFGKTQDHSARAPETQELDNLIRPVLKKLFGDAKIISESLKPQTCRDGEVIENSMIYSVKQRLISSDGQSLHKALIAAHFSTSPRLGSKPTILKRVAMMSLFKTTPRRPYSLVIKIDVDKQQIVVESYRLGSRYDRLM